MDVTLQDIKTYLSEVKNAVKYGRYRIDQNDRRQDNLNLFLKYIIDEAKAKEILLSLTAKDFSEMRRNEHKGYEHDYYIFLAKIYYWWKDLVIHKRWFPCT